MSEPLHVGTVCGRPLRFFRTPMNDRASAAAMDKLANTIPFAFGTDQFFDWFKAAINRWSDS